MSWSPADIPSLTGRRALVTGVASGPGRAVVEALARRGAEVVLADRRDNEPAAAVDTMQRAAPDAVLRPLELDLADLSSVREAAAEAATYGPLHLLVHVGADPALGRFALTGLLLPRLVDSGGARVVSAVPVGQRPQRGRARLAGRLFAFELDRRAREARLPVSALAAQLGLTASAPSAAHGPSRGRILDAALSLLGQSPGRAVEPVLMAATADLPGSTYVAPGGPGGLTGAPRVVLATRHSRDPETARRLWEVAQDATGVVYP